MVETVHNCSFLRKKEVIMNIIKAIETRYKGYRFRSRLEARYAVFFDALGIEWEYEKEGYDLGVKGWYLPDFSIKTSSDRYWLCEVKGDLLDRPGIEKARYLDDFPPYPYMGVLMLTSLDFADFNKRSVAAQLLGVSILEFNTAINKARSARFEHGERP